MWSAECQGDRAHQRQSFICYRSPSPSQPPYRLDISQFYRNQRSLTSFMPCTPDDRSVNKDQGGKNVSLLPMRTKRPHWSHGHWVTRRAEKWKLYGHVWCSWLSHHLPGVRLAQSAVMVCIAIQGCTVSDLC